MALTRMSVATETETLAPPGRAPGLRWLRRELAPFPGRGAMTLRMLAAVLLVTVISMALRTPLTAISAYMVFFVTKENREITTITGVGLALGATIGIALSLWTYRITFDEPALRIPVMAATVFCGMFLSRVLAIGPLAFAIGFVVALTQSIAELEPDADVLVRSLLWVWVILVFPVAITVIVNQVLLPADPWKSLLRGLTRRLDAAAAALRRALGEGSEGGRPDPGLRSLATRGSSALLHDLKFATLKNREAKRRQASLAAAIVAGDRLVAAGAALDLREPRPLAGADAGCAQALLLELSLLRVRLARGKLDPTPPAAEGAAALPELRELQLAVAALREGLTGDHPAGAPSHGREAKSKTRLLLPDAFTNPDHVHFALKVTIAAMSCYVIYTGLDWPGIRTAFITCCFIALESTGATIRKGRLRLAGCLIGGLLGFLSILHLVPRMEGIASLVLLTAAGTAPAAWVAAGSERISYAGLQMALAFFLCIFQGFSPGTDFDTIRNRIVGILLGLAVSTFVYQYLWPESASNKLRAKLAGVLRALARLALTPSAGASLESEKKSAQELRAEIANGVNEALKLSELAALEDPRILRREGLSMPRLLEMTRQAQAASLIAAVLASETELAEWSRLDPQAQATELTLRTQAADRLHHAAGALEAGRRTDPGAVDTSTADWDHAAMEAVESNDRGRLLRQLLEQVQLLSPPSLPAGPPPSLPSPFRI